MITAYRRGDDYTLEPPGSGEWEPVRLEMMEGVRVDRSARGELLVYRGFLAYGTQVSTALSLGWCRLADPTPSFGGSVPPFTSSH